MLLLLLLWARRFNLGQDNKNTHKLNLHTVDNKQYVKNNISIEVKLLPPVSLDGANYANTKPLTITEP